jgi:hypothetical protein
MKKSVITIVVGLFLASTNLVPSFGATTTVNGSSCAKVGAISIVKVKGISKAYICKVNPAISGATMPTWTLKTCLSYWAAAQNSQSSINQQRSLVGSMSEPDKTNYTKQLDGSQASLNKVIAAIISNHCKAGL